MRVAIVQPSLAAYRAPFYRRLAQERDIDFVVHYTQSPKIASVAPEGFSAVEERDAREIHLGPLALQWRPFELRIARDPSYDAVVYSWNARDLHVGRALRLARRRGKAVLLWGHGYSKRDSRLRAALRLRLARQADVVILYDRKTRDRLARQEPDLKERLAVAPNALDQAHIQQARRAWLDHPDRLATFQSDHRLAGKKILLFVSRLYAENRLDLLLHAMPSIRKAAPETALIVIGDGPDRARLERIASSLELNDAVRFLGSVYSEENLAPWFLSARVFVYPSNIGLSLLHAFGYGLPVITADDPSKQNPEFVAFAHEHNGLGCRYGDAQSLTHAVLRLLQDDELHSRLSKNAERTALERFSIDAMAHGFAEALRAAVSRLR